MRLASPATASKLRAPCANKTQSSQTGPNGIVYHQVAARYTPIKAISARLSSLRQYSSLAVNAVTLEAPDRPGILRLPPG